MVVHTALVPYTTCQVPSTEPVETKTGLTRIKTGVTRITPLVYLTDKMIDLEIRKPTSPI